VNKLPTLYKKNVNGSIQQWTVWTEGNTVITEYGQMGGSLQTTSDTVKGKNVGRSNETTDEEQAALKAKQQWDKKVKERYVEDIKKADKGESEVEGYKPMLAHPIEKKKKHAIFPAIAQPKLDGLRCLAIVDKGKAKLYSRTGKPITTLPHIIEQLEDAYEGDKGRHLLDGELYNHDLKDDFNKIASVIKRDKVHPDHEIIKYYIYDTVSDVRYSVRTTPVIDAVENFSHLEFLPWTDVGSEDELMEYFQQCLNEGYEGAMYRHPTMGYEHKRSAALLKVKEMADDEFVMVDVEEGNGKLQGKAGAIWCETKDGKRFKAKMKGALEDLDKYLVNFKKDYKGKMLTVQYQNLTPDGVPRFPVGVRVRGEE